MAAHRVALCLKLTPSPGPPDPPFPRPDPPFFENGNFTKFAYTFWIHLLAAPTFWIYLLDPPFGRSYLLDLPFGSTFWPRLPFGSTFWIHLLAATFWTFWIHLFLAPGSTFFLGKSWIPGLDFKIEEKKNEISSNILIFLEDTSGTNFPIHLFPRKKVDPGLDLKIEGKILTNFHQIFSSINLFLRKKWIRD